MMKGVMFHDDNFWYVSLFLSWKLNVDRLHNDRGMMNVVKTMNISGVNAEKETYIICVFDKWRIQCSLWWFMKNEDRTCSSLRESGFSLRKFGISPDPDFIQNPDFQSKLFWLSNPNFPEIGHSKAVMEEITDLEQNAWCTFEAIFDTIAQGIDEACSTLKPRPNKENVIHEGYIKNWNHSHPTPPWRYQNSDNASRWHGA